MTAPFSTPTSRTGAALVVDLDLPAQFGDAGADLIRGEQHLGQVVGDVGGVHVP